MNLAALILTILTLALRPGIYSLSSLIRAETRCETWTDENDSGYLIMKGEAIEIGHNGRVRAIWRCGWPRVIYMDKAKDDE